MEPPKKGGEIEVKASQSYTSNITHEARVADFLVDTIDPQFIVTIASENPATQDDLAFVARYGFELLARQSKQHIFYFLAGGGQPIRKATKGGPRLFHHFHACFRFENTNDYKLHFVEKCVASCLARASKRSRKQFYNKTPEEAVNLCLKARNPNACAKLQYDLRMNTDVKRYGADDKTGFANYTVRHSQDELVFGVEHNDARNKIGIINNETDLVIEVGCPRKSHACNRLQNERNAGTGKIIKGRTKRVCALLDDGKLLAAIQQST